MTLPPASPPVSTAAGLVFPSWSVFSPSFHAPEKVCDVLGEYVGCVLKAGAEGGEYVAYLDDRPKAEVRGKAEVEE